MSHIENDQPRPPTLSIADTPLGRPQLGAETGAAVRRIVDQLVLRYTDETDRHAWVVAFSGGKDSTLVTHLVFEALKRVRPSRRTRPVCVLSSDTLVETPAIAEFVITQLDPMQYGARQLSLPITTKLVRPELHETISGARHSVV